MERQVLDYQLLRNDPGGGWWFLNWGRNLTFPTEATYHAVVAACWLAVLKERWGWSILAAAGIAATHPFTGFAVLLSLFAWTGLSAALDRSSRALVRWLVFGLLLAGFLAYNLVFLERDPEHRAVREQMTVAWMLGVVSMVLAYTGVAMLAAGRIVRQWPRLGRDAGFLIVCFSVAFALANHGWFVRPRQPIHFTRGYIWMPLCLLGLPYLQHLFVTWRERLGQGLFSCVIGLFMGVAVADNAGFVLSYWRVGELGIVLTQSEWDALDWLRRQNCSGVLVTSDRQLTYLASTYTRVRSYYSHWHHTPHYAQRVAEAEEWFRTGRPAPWLAQVDYWLVPKRFEELTLDRLCKADARHWRQMHANANLVLIGHDP
jgi:hypothetical protein